MDPSPIYSRLRCTSGITRPCCAYSPPILRSNIDLPSIAYSVPDLDAYAQVILTNQDTGEEALCLGATLSNGKTVFDNRVQWAIGGLTIAAFVGALIHSFWPLTPYKSGPEWRFATVLSYFQHVAICGFLSLDYPVVYKCVHSAL